MSNLGTSVGIYAQLDTLLDTRMGTIARMDPDLAVKVLQSGYHKRFSDVFPGVDMVAFDELYKNRDTLTLAYSVMTECVVMIRDLVKSAAEQAVTRPYHNGAKLTVNAYPYNLSIEENREIILSLESQLDNQCVVEIVRLSPQELTPQMCHKLFAALFVYEHDGWLDMHVANFQKKPIPEIDMYAPGLFRDGTPSAELMEKRKREVGHPFKALEEMAKPLIKLQLLDSRIFSLTVE